MKDLVITTYWGTTEFAVGEDKTSPKMFVTNRGPRGGNPASNFISPLEALGLAEYLKAWAIEGLK